MEQAFVLWALLFWPWLCCAAGAAVMPKPIRMIAAVCITFMFLYGYLLADIFNLV